jgi:capsid assembly protease
MDDVLKEMSLASGSSVHALMGLPMHLLNTMTGLVALDIATASRWYASRCQEPEYQLIADGSPEAMATLEKLSASEKIGRDASVHVRKMQRDASVHVRKMQRDGWVQASKNLSIIPISGAIQKDSDWYTRWGYGTSVRDFTRSLAEAAAATPRTLIYIDSPGGTVDGTPEAGDAVASLVSKGYPVYAVASGAMTSAAYWIGAQAKEVWAAPATDVGSIGVRMTHTDMSKALERWGYNITSITSGTMKAAGAPWKPLSEEERAYFQASVNAAAEDFYAAVTKGRKGRMSAESLADAARTAAVYDAKTALKMGLIDGIAHVGDVIDALK